MTRFAFGVKVYMGPDSAPMRLHQVLSDGWDELQSFPVRRCLLAVRSGRQSGALLAFVDHVSGLKFRAAQRCSNTWPRTAHRRAERGPRAAVLTSPGAW